MADRIGEPQQSGRRPLSTADRVAVEIVIEELRGLIAWLDHHDPDEEWPWPDAIASRFSEVETLVEEHHELLLLVLAPLLPKAEADYLLRSSRGVPVFERASTGEVFVDAEFGATARRRLATLLARAIADSPPAETPPARERRSSVDRAIDLLLRAQSDGDAYLSMRAVAVDVGCAHSTLAGSERFRRTWRTYKESRGGVPPHGWKREGSVEADDGA